MHTVVGHPIATRVTFIGAFGVGKSTAVRQLSSVPVIHTEVASSPVVRGGRNSAKRHTTVGIDYGEWRPPAGERITLIGTPGQRRFRAVQRIVSPRTTAFVLLVYGNHEHAAAEAMEWIEYFGGDRIAPRLVVGVTRLGEGGPPLPEIAAGLAGFGADAPVLGVDPRSRDSVARAVTAAVARGTRTAATPAPPMTTPTQRTA